MSTLPGEIQPSAQEAALRLPQRLSALESGTHLWSDAVQSRSHRTRLKFHGDWTDYWRIWIVNLALTVLTLGIYSAWAKVRTKRWFYGQVELDGSRFHYHGQPIPILKGRLIMAGLVITWLVCAQLGPVWVGAALLAFVLALPWLVVRAAAFRAWNSSWRGLRFSFDGAVSGAFLVYALPVFVGFGVLMLAVLLPKEMAGWPTLFVALIVSIGVPFLLAEQKRFVVSHHRFGINRFDFSGSGGTLWAIYFVVGLLFIPLNLLSIPLRAVLEGAAIRLYQWLAAWEWSWLLKHFEIVGPLLLAPVILLASLPAVFGLGYLRGRSAVWQWQDTRLRPDIRFDNQLNPWELAATYLVNGLAIALSLGLLTPWALVRTARLRAQSMVVVSDQPLDQFSAGQQQAVGATGDEVGDLMGLDVGL